MWINKADLQSIIHNRDVLAATRDALVERVNALQEDNSNIQLALNACEARANSLNGADSANARIIQSLKDDAATYKSIINNNNREISDLNKALKKQKNKTVFAEVLGSVGLIALGVLYFLK